MTRYHQYEAPLLAHSVLDCQRSFTHTLLCALLRRQIRGIGARPPSTSNIFFYHTSELAIKV